MIIDDLQKINPFSLDKKEKKIIFNDQIKLLTLHHYNFCKEYKKIIQNLKFKIKKEKNLENFPMLPVKLFKKFKLKSISDDKIVKQLVSSGTSGNELSKIYKRIFYFHSRFYSRT